ncbi:MAG: hypothetical protein ACOYON_03725 [Fimbriimonas sp.]
MDFLFWKVTLGVIVTLGLFSSLYKENKFYRFCEHLFLGLAAGWTLVAIWTETLKENWWDKLAGLPAEGTAPGTPGYWAWVLLVPFGLMGYFVFSKKHNWISRIPIGIILGLWSGQQIQVWWTRYGPQINSSMRPLLPNNTSSFRVPGTTGKTPEQIAEITASVYPTQAITNIIAVFTVIAVLSYFLFSFDVKNKLIRSMSTSGRWLLMVGFGAIFGNTVAMRFTLLIDRMYFIWFEWLIQTVLRR